MHSGSHRHYHLASFRAGWLHTAAGPVLEVSCRTQLTLPHGRAEARFWCRIFV